jgi:DNA-binding transcriptional ArsR family regulator
MSQQRQADPNPVVSGKSPRGVAADISVSGEAGSDVFVAAAGIWLDFVAIGPDSAGLDIFPHRHTLVTMPRAATTSDAFNAIAEPRRRDILEYLALRERPVGDIVVELRLAQPSVSKHLRVLREVGLVDVRRDGRNVLYRTNVEAMRPLHEWTSRFERYWQHQLARIKERAERS